MIIIKKSICYIADSIFDLGGIQRVITNLANELYKYYDITIICTKKIKESKRLNYMLNKNIKVLEFENSLLTNTLLFPARVIKHLNHRFNIFKINSKVYDYIEYHIDYIPKKKIEKFLLNSNFDCVIGAGMQNIIFLSKLKQIKGIKYYGWWHSNFDQYVNGNFFSRKYIEKSLKKMNKTIVLSQDDKEKIEREFGVKTYVMYNISNNFNVSSNSKVHTTQKNMLAVGRYTNVKKFDKLINIFYLFNTKCHDWNLYIVGEGPNRRKLEYLIKQYQLTDKIHLTGQTNNIQEYYNKSSIFVMTSKNEGFPMVLLEAMNFGLVPVVYEVPVFYEIIKNCKSGYIIPQDSQNEFVDRLVDLSLNDDKRLKMSNEAKNEIKKFNTENIVEEWKKILG